MRRYQSFTLLTLLAGALSVWAEEPKVPEGALARFVVPGPAASSSPVIETLAWGPRVVDLILGKS